MLVKSKLAWRSLSNPWIYSTSLSRAGVYASSRYVTHNIARDANILIKTPAAVSIRKVGQIPSRYIQVWISSNQFKYPSFKWSSCPKKESQAKIGLIVKQFRLYNIQSDIPCRDFIMRLTNSRCVVAVGDIFKILVCIESFVGCPIRPRPCIQN